MLCGNAREILTHEQNQVGSHRYARKVFSLEGIVSAR